jgi:hypothetical protein
MLVFERVAEDCDQGFKGRHIHVDSDPKFAGDAKLGLPELLRLLPDRGGRYPRRKATN